jgi:hypothetical protein
LYHKARKCHFARASTVCRRRGVSRGVTSASTCKTFSSRVIQKTFSVEIHIIIFVKILPYREFIFFHWQHKRSKKRLWHHKSQSIPQVFKIVVVLSVISNHPSLVVHKGCRRSGRPPVSLITPSASTDSIQIDTLTLSVANLNFFIKNSCFDFLAKARKCHFPDDLEFRRMEN